MRASTSLVAFVCLALTACSSGGGGGGGNNGGNSGGGNPPPGGGSGGGFPGIVFAGPPVVEVYLEAEPNDTMVNATPVPLTDTVAAADVSIMVGDVDIVGGDVFDYFSITANYSREHVVQLCADNCTLGSNTGNLPENTAYFDVLDAAGNIIASSATDASDSNILEVDLSAGVIYYVVVTGVNTPSPSQFYSAIIIDTDES